MFAVSLRISCDFLAAAHRLPAGSVTVKVTVLRALAAVMAPPWASTICRAMASPSPEGSGHWAQMAFTGVWSKARRASKMCRACSPLSAAGPSFST